MKKLKISSAITQKNNASFVRGNRSVVRGKAIFSALGLLALSFCAGALQAATLNVPNGSFETPTPPPGFPAFPLVDNWLKPAQPIWFDPQTAGISWDQLSGVFPNTAVGTSNHIDNVDGNQAAYMFALPQVALYQDAFNSTFDVGKSYKLTVGILGGGGIPAGTSFELDLYYRDSANNPVNVASTPIIFDSAIFPNATHLIDFDVNVAAVKAGDAWAGKSIGVQLLSTSGTGVGYWDVDNVRLTATSVPEPTAVSLLVLGIGGLLFVRRSTQRRK